MSFLSAQNFYGLDIQPFAVEIAKVTMMIARKLAIDELHITEPALPLDNLDQNFIAADALLTPDGQPAQWPKADVIIGNPPFLGAKRLKPERGPDYVNTVRHAYPEVPGMADYCVYWFRKAARPSAALHRRRPCGRPRRPRRHAEHPQQPIPRRRPRSCRKTGTIIEAVDNQPWSGEANVHVSIANWVKTQDAALLPKTRKLWFKVPASTGRSRERGTAGLQRIRIGFPRMRHINSALSDQIDVSGAKSLTCNTKPQRVLHGQVPGQGFVLTDRERQKLLKRKPHSGEVVFPYLMGRDVFTGSGTPTRWVIDFGDKDQLQAAAFTAAFAMCRPPSFRRCRICCQEGTTR